MRHVEVAFTTMLILSCLTAVRTSVGQEMVIYNFGASATDGGNPSGDLLVDAKGNLFGTTIFTGYTNGGTVFELSPVAGGGWTEKVLHRFNRSFASPPDGAIPESSLISDKQGNLYGTTIDGGVNCGSGTNQLCGTIFEVSPAADGSWTEKVIYAFGTSSANDGFFPYGNMVFDAQGNLYGTTADGGQAGYGTVFELSPTGGGAWTEQVLHSFGTTHSDGAGPAAGLTIDSTGNLYGTTFDGFGIYASGTVFELVRHANGAWAEKILHAFNPALGDGSGPLCKLLLDSKGNLFGTTYRGGNNDAGTVFELSPTALGIWTEKVLNVDSGPGSGANPHAGLTMDSQGNLYGTTLYGGANAPNPGNGGTVFKLAPQPDGTWTKTILHSFLATSTDGNSVFGGVIFGPGGNLYGMTGAGGTHGLGTVFEIENLAATPQVGTTTTLAANPNSNLIAGDPITLTAIVTPSSGMAVPTGTVTFAAAGGSIAVPLNSAGEAIYFGRVPPAGTYSVNASYSGSAGFSMSTSDTITRSVAAH